MKETITPPPMTLPEATKILSEHQNWRIGKSESYLHKPSEITQAIDLVLESVRKDVKPFSTKHELSEFIQRNILFSIKATKKSNTPFVGVFTSNNAMKAVIDELTDRLWDRLRQGTFCVYKKWRIFSKKTQYEAPKLN
jgi:hypothetical protein